MKILTEAPKFPKVGGVTYADGMYARVSVDGKFYWAPIEIKRQTPVPIEGATSYIYRKMINGKREVTKLGRNLAEAFTQWRNLDADAERIKQGKAPLNPQSAEASDKTRRTIHDAVEAYIASNADKVLKNKRRPRSVEAYNKAVIDFRDSVSVRYMDEIDDKVLQEHEAWILDPANVKRRKTGKRENTVANRFRYLTTFLKKNGIKLSKDLNSGNEDRGLLDYDDAPKPVLKPIDTYSEDEVRALMTAATIDQQDLIQFFINLGVRDGEAMHAQWSDIKKEDGEYVFHVQEKDHWGWKPKNKNDRKIPMSQKLYDRLMARKARLGFSKHNLIFPNGNGDPDDHLIGRLHKVWAAVQELAKKNGALELSGRSELHRFRRTYITVMLRNGTPFREVMACSGHTDLKSFMRYIDATSKPGRSGAEKMSSYGD